MIQIFVTGSVYNQQFFPKDELKSTLLRFRICCHVWRPSSNGENQSGKQWFTVKCWGRTAANVGPHLRPGTRACISGRFSIEEFQKRDGTKGQEPTIIADDITFFNERHAPPAKEPEHEWDEPPAKRAPAKPIHLAGGAPTEEFEFEDFPP